MAIFTHSSLLVIEFVRAEGIEQGELSLNLYIAGMC